MKNQFETGDELETTVVAISGDTVFIDVGLKSEGFVDLAEFKDENGTITVKEGDSIKVFYASSKGDELYFTTKVSGQAANAMLESAWKSGIPVEGHVEKEIKGGYEVKIGSARAFCPYSQMGYRQKAESAEFVGKHLTFKIMEYKNDGKDLLVSNRRVLEEAEKAKTAALADTLTVGSVVTGTVKSIQSYGAFIDLDGFQALLPISEISHQRINDVSEKLSVGQTIQAKVIKADWVHEKVSLSMKSLEKDPWEEAASQFEPGTKVSGTIARTAGFGLFVNLAPGIDGLVHISTLEGVSASTNLAKKYKVGDKFDVVVENVDVENKRISLTPASSAEQDESAASYLSGHAGDDDGETYNPFAALLKK